MKNRESGTLLIEMVISLALITVGLLGFLLSFAGNFTQTKDILSMDEVRAALEDAVEDLRDETLSTVYAQYNNTTRTISNLPGPTSGSSATLQIRCHVNETAIPSQFGPVADLDGTAGLTNTDCSASYLLLPVQLTLTYGMEYGTETRDVYVVLGPSN